MAVLLPAKYRLIFLQREKNLAEVHFLHPPDNAIVARTMVDYEQRSNTDPARETFTGW